MPGFRKGQRHNVKHAVSRLTLRRTAHTWFFSRAALTNVGALLCSRSVTSSWDCTVRTACLCISMRPRSSARKMWSPDWLPHWKMDPSAAGSGKRKKKKKAGLSSVFYISPLGEEIYTMIPCCWPILAYFPFTSYCIIWPWPTIKKDLQAVSLFSLGSHPKTAADRCWKWPTDSLSDSLMPFHWLLPPPGMFSVCLETSYFPFQTQPS